VRYTKGIECLEGDVAPPRRRLKEAAEKGQVPSWFFSFYYYYFEFLSDLFKK
jgi:hypothetical protein